jgi:hypothetical protein
MQNLTLPLIKKWFEKTKARIKPEDYREINAYWIKRFVETDIENPKIGEALCCLRDGYEPDQVKSSYRVWLKPFSQNIMTLGYPKKNNTERILKLEHKGIEIRTGNPDWGAEPGKVYFVIKHGNILK